MEIVAISRGKEKFTLFRIQNNFSQEVTNKQTDFRFEWWTLKTSIHEELNFQLYPFCSFALYLIRL